MNIILIQIRCYCVLCSCLLSTHIVAPCFLIMHICHKAKVSSTKVRYIIKENRIADVLRTFSKAHIQLLCDKRFWIVKIQNSYVNNRFPKRHQGNFNEFKMLACKRNTDNGDKKQQAKNNVANGQPDAGTEKPDKI